MICYDIQRVKNTHGHEKIYMKWETDQHRSVATIYESWENPKTGLRMDSSVIVIFICIHSKLWMCSAEAQRSETSNCQYEVVYWLWRTGRRWQFFGTLVATFLHGAPWWICPMECSDRRHGFGEATCPWTEASWRSYTSFFQLAFRKCQIRKPNLATACFHVFIQTIQTLFPNYMQLANNARTGPFTSLTKVSTCRHMGGYGGTRNARRTFAEVDQEAKHHLYLVGGLDHFLFFHILGIIIPTDFHIFQRGRSTTNQFQSTLKGRQCTTGVSDTPLDPAWLINQIFWTYWPGNNIF